MCRPVPPSHPENAYPSRRDFAPSPGFSRSSIWRVCACLLAGIPAAPLHAAPPGAAVSQGAVASAPAPAPVRGLPFIRYYPFEDIGSISRGARLSFDAFGRVVAVQDGAYVVLNDASWIDIAERGGATVSLLSSIVASDGHTYYAASGDWGIADLDSDGKVRPRSLAPPDAPAWATANGFSEVLATRNGVYFGGRDGIVFFDFKTTEQKFFPLRAMSRMFAVNDRVFASLNQGRIHFIDIERTESLPIAGTEFDGMGVDQATRLDDTHALLATRGGRMLMFDGVTATPWPGQQAAGLEGRVSALQRLEEGNLAVALIGKGVFLVSPEGKLQRSLTTPEFHGITGLAANEPGVLWVATDSGVEKILYNSPISRFGQQLGLPISWPQVARWGDRIMIVSSGRLYEQSVDADGGLTHFQRVKAQPLAGVWTLATAGDRLLLGNAQGVFASDGRGGFTQVLSGFDVARLVMVENDLCYVIGPSHIAVLQWRDGGWAEVAPRIPGVGYPSVTHATKAAAWIELGPNGVARVSFHDGRIRTRVFDTFPWSRRRWVNLGIVGDIVVISGPPGGRIFFDETSEELTDAPALRAMLESAPSWISRVKVDQKGTFWASHEHGILTIPPADGRAAIDASTFDIIDDRAPLVQLLPDGDVWISTGYSLYHVDQRSALESNREPAPVLVSVSGRQATSAPAPALLRGGALTGSSSQMTFGGNDLQFRFFAGTYASYRSPTYEYRLDQSGDNWTSLGTGSVVNFSKLREGQYHLDVRVRDNRGPRGAQAAVVFAILPPWYRTPAAFAGYALAAVLAIAGLVRWAGQRTRGRNQVLEQLVQERTNELRRAMQKLNEEARNAATLAERDRLACEIHDSLQQGLSGLILQLDATLKLGSLSADVRSRLTVARNMVSFTRHEVQHAVWDLESPLLEGADLETALKQITRLISPGTVTIRIETVGEPFPLTSTIKHHLLRMAQEAITNAVRHAAAQTISVRIEFHAREVTLSIADDGRGFDPAAALANGLGHFGLRGLRGRAGKIAGEVRIDSAPGRGSSISVTVPIHDIPTSHAHADLTAAS